LLFGQLLLHKLLPTSLPTVATKAGFCTNQPLRDPFGSDMVPSALHTQQTQQTGQVAASSAVFSDSLT
jgi:hypothetical protein